MFTVTRQCQWPDGKNVVEVSIGGIDYTNPDALSAKYSGEFEEYKNPREAVSTAIEIARQWRKDSGKRIAVAVGNTHGMTIPFSPDTQAHAIAWAKQVWESLPKCAGCNEPLPDSERERWHANDWDGLEYCSERCATRAAEFEAELEAEQAAEEN
jgi:hypothetical protein